MQSRRSQRCDFWPTRQNAKYLPTSRTFCTTPLPRCFLERRKSRTLASQSNLPGEQCSPLLSPADPQNSLRQKPCRRTCGGDGCCATPRATVSSLVARSERTSARRARAAKRAGAAPIPAARSAMPRSIPSASLPERLATMRLGISLQAKATYRESNALPYLYLQAFDA